MRIGSLRLRLLLAASGAILLALAIAGFALVWLFERHVERRLGAELDTYLNQLAARTVFGPDGRPAVSGKLADPRFEQVYSGLYWQIVTEDTGQYARSRSLWDTSLALPQDTPPIGAIHVHGITGPQDKQLLTHERRLVFGGPRGERVLRLAVAIDRAGVLDLRRDFAMEVGAFLLLLAAVLILAAWLQVDVGLKPLAAIRRAVGAVRDGRASRVNVSGPSEIAPLVDEVNSLLQAQDEEMRRARDRAADLAHGFKTPLTALLSDAKRLRGKGESEIAEGIEQTAMAMRGHVERELTRARLRNASRPGAVELGPIVTGVVETLRRTPRGELVEISLDVEDGLSARMARDDLNEILGNLLENAMRHAARRIMLRAVRHGPFVRIEIEDDGPGIAEEERKSLTRRGARLDNAPTGAGLGLAIVSELLGHHEQELRLDRSALGGLKVSFDLKAA